MTHPEHKLNQQKDALHALTTTTRALSKAHKATSDATTARDNAIRAAADAGLSYRDIAAVTGLSHARITQIRNHTR